jgi:hypothetical protein
MSKTHQDIISELNGYAAEINKVIQGEPDEETGLHKNGPLLGEFLGNRVQLNTFYSMINLSDSIMVDCAMPLSTNLLVECSIGAVHRMQDLLKESMEKLEAMRKE